MSDLTLKDKKTLDFIVQYQGDNGYSPSLSEIKKALGTKSTRGAILHINKLIKYKYIERKENTRRAIKVLVKTTSSSKETINAPILGDVKAGFGGIADQVLEGYKSVSLSLTGGRRDIFFLRVNGDSMSKAGINTDDLVLVAPQSIASSGDIVIAYDNERDEGTIKRLKRLKEFMVLLPESDNSTHEPRIGTNFLIQGKVIGLLPSNSEKLQRII